MKHLIIQSWPRIGGNITFPCKPSLTCRYRLFSWLCWFDKHTASPCREHSTGFKGGMRAQPRTEAVSPSHPAWSQLTSQGMAGLGHGLTCRSHWLCCFQGACGTYRAMVGFLQMFRVRRIGCGGLGEVHQSRDKGVGLVNSKDRSAPVSFSNTSAISAWVGKAWMSWDLQTALSFWLSDIRRDGLCLLKDQPAVAFLHNHGDWSCWACLELFWLFLGKEKLKLQYPKKAGGQTLHFDPW